MALDGAVSVTPIAPNQYLVTFSEIAPFAIGDEITIAGLPRVGAILRQTCIPTAGTVQPIIGRVADPVTNVNDVIADAQSSALVDIQGYATYRDLSDAGATTVSLFHRTRAAGQGPGDSIYTEYHIRGEG